jgi:hypothetical protein
MIGARGVAARGAVTLGARNPAQPPETASPTRAMPHQSRRRVQEVETACAQRSKYVYVAPALSRTAGRSGRLLLSAEVQPGSIVMPQPRRHRPPHHLMLPQLIPRRPACPSSSRLSSPARTHRTPALASARSSRKTVRLPLLSRSLAPLRTTGPSPRPARTGSPHP